MSPLHALVLFLILPLPFARAEYVPQGVQVGATMCACPGKHRPLGSAANCEEACYGKSGSGGAGDSGASALTPLIQQGIQELFKPEDPAEAARRREEERAREVEAARVRKEKDDKMDAEAGSLLGLTEGTKIVGDDELLKDAYVGTPTPKPVPKIHLDKAKFARQSDKRSGRAPTSLVACTPNDENSYLCSENACGGTPGPTCCPKSFPYLNPCDCQCYYSNYDIQGCSSYTACQYTWRPK